MGGEVSPRVIWNGDSAARKAFIQQGRERRDFNRLGQGKKGGRTGEP